MCVREDERERGRVRESACKREEVSQHLQDHLCVRVCICEYMRVRVRARERERGSVTASAAPPAREHGRKCVRERKNERDRKREGERDERERVCA